MRRVECRLGLGPLADPVSKFIDLNNKEKEVDISDAPNSEEAVNIRRVVRTAMEKKLLEKKLEILMKKKKGILTTEEDEAKQMKKRLKVESIPGIDCPLPNFEVFIPVFSIPEKTGISDWQTRIKVKSVFEKQIISMFAEPSFETVMRNQFSVQAAIVTSLCVVELASGMLSGSIYENIQILTETESRPTPIDKLHSEIDELIFHRKNLTQLITNSIHGTDKNSGLLEDARRNLEQNRLECQAAVVNDGDLIISEIVKSQVLHTGSSFWGVQGCSDFSLEMAGSKLCPSDELFDTFRKTFLPDHEYIPPLHGASPGDFGTLKQASKARVPCRNDFHPGRCNTIPCTFIHENGHAASEYSNGKRILSVVACMPQVLKNSELLADLSKLREKFLDAFLVCRDNLKNSNELHTVLEEVLYWVYYKIGGGGDTFLDNKINWGSDTEELPEELSAVELQANDIAWKTVTRKISCLHDIAFGQLQVKYPDSEEIAIAIASVRMSCLPGLSLQSVKMSKLTTKISPEEEDIPQVIRLHEFEAVTQQFPCCLPLYVLYVEAIARLDESKIDTYTSIVSVLTTALNHCTAFSLSLSDDDYRKSRISHTIFSLILFVTFIRIADSSAVDYLRKLMSGGTANLEKIMLPQHYAALPIIFASCVANVFPKTMARVWPLTNGVPLVLEWDKISSKDLDPEILFYFKSFIDSQSWTPENLSSRDCLVINKCRYVAVCGNPTAAVSELVRVCAMDPRGPSICLFKALADIEENFDIDIAAGFDTFRLYEGITGGGTPEWNGTAAILHINVLLRRGSLSDVVAITSKADTFASPFKEMVGCISCLLRGDTATYLSSIKAITDSDNDVHHQILAEILKFQGNDKLVCYHYYFFFVVCLEED